MSHGHCSEDVGDDPDLVKKVIIGDKSWTLKSMRNYQNGKRFATIEEIKENLKQELLVIPKSAFQKFFENWKKRWHK